MKITQSKKIVESLLRAKPHLRDDDNELLAWVWRVQIEKKGQDINRLSAYDLLVMIKDKMLANAESVRRCRAKFQEVNPELRGKVYYERHKEKKIVEVDLRNFVV